MGRGVEVLWATFRTSLPPAAAPAPCHTGWVRGVPAASSIFCALVPIFPCWLGRCWLRCSAPLGSFQSTPTPASPVASRAAPTTTTAAAAVPPPVDGIMSTREAGAPATAEGRLSMAFVALPATLSSRSVGVRRADAAACQLNDASDRRRVAHWAPGASSHRAVRFLHALPALRVVVFVGGGCGWSERLSAGCGTPTRFFLLAVTLTSIAPFFLCTAVSSVNTGPRR